MGRLHKRRGNANPTCTPGLWGNSQDPRFSCSVVHSGFSIGFRNPKYSPGTNRQVPRERRNRDEDAVHGRSRCDDVKSRLLGSADAQPAPGHRLHRERTRNLSCRQSRLCQIATRYRHASNACRPTAYRTGGRFGMAHLSGTRVRLSDDERKRWPGRCPPTPFGWPVNSTTAARTCPR
jgi:hypothetical protein